jgi:hypothetical protein
MVHVIGKSGVVAHQLHTQICKVKDKNWKTNCGTIMISYVIAKLCTTVQTKD